MKKNKRIFAANIILGCVCVLLLIIIFSDEKSPSEKIEDNFGSTKQILQDPLDTPLDYSENTSADNDNASNENSLPNGVEENTTKTAETTTKTAETTTKTAETTTKTAETTSANNSLNTDNIGVLPVPVVISISESDFSMTLVNRKYRMPDNYNIQLTPCISGSDIKLDYRVSPHYEAMYKAAKADGITLTPYSGYRSYTRQQTNYNNKTQYYMNQGYTKAQAQTLAARIIMPPGSSEHNLGLAMDICGTSYSFDKTKEFKWLKENAEDYGFILRYPENKQHITQVVFEPWHWRYVGVENAKAINASGLCMEEFLGKDAG